MRIGATRSLTADGANHADSSSQVRQHAKLSLASPVSLGQNIFTRPRPLADTGNVDSDATTILGLTGEGRTLRLSDGAARTRTLESLKKTTGVVSDEFDYPDAFRHRP